ncbi:SdpI family protein [Alkalicella caledoniensis]|uniref:SdpI family protein n=1 Tax=Alkalicella caledoniensis TaxID=2731377 RepID=A0A7G9W678_ALKCA|nr:SdpI family protein [Alkalicella caledoniensis]QNO14190.1 SdpI family protein [Alkalicella caledoniensis]
MTLFFWIVDLLIPVSMIIIGILFRTRPPKNINYIYGYRTKRSMKSKEAWDYAHKLCGAAYLLMGILILVIVSIGKLQMSLAPEYLSLINAGIGIIALVIPIPYIEMKLKGKIEKK